MHGVVTIDLTKIGPMFVGTVDGQKVLRFTVSGTANLEDLVVKQVGDRVRYKQLPEVNGPKTTKEMMKLLDMDRRQFKRFARKHGVGATGVKGAESVYSQKDAKKLLLMKDTEA